MSSSAGIRCMYRDPRVIMLVNKFQAYDASQLIGELDMLGLNRRGKRAASQPSNTFHGQAILF